ncbi:hypothetical protein AMTR_s00002p00272030 [Amborella trichopoda]|uniref:Uncharacterized protein n=1 Tax=Amborella trichopoda TaxID=13333 RepID=W1P3P0_AMBTC|nr:hypothetical protein AMTR_s00002p00272030 [Amborella trichopoda]
MQNPNRQMFATNHPLKPYKCPLLTRPRIFNFLLEKKETTACKSIFTALLLLFLLVFPLLALSNRDPQREERKRKEKECKSQCERSREGKREVRQCKQKCEERYRRDPQREERKRPEKECKSECVRFRERKCEVKQCKQECEGRYRREKGQGRDIGDRARARASGDCQERLVILTLLSRRHLRHTIPLNMGVLRFFLPSPRGPNCFAASRTIASAP